MASSKKKWHAAAATGLLFVGGWAGWTLRGGPESAPISPTECGDDKSIVIDEGHNPAAFDVKYATGEDDNKKAATGLVRLSLTASGVEVAASSKKTEAQTANPTQAALDPKLTAAIIGLAADEDQERYPAVPEVVLPLVRNDGLNVIVDFSQPQGSEELHAAVKVSCNGTTLSWHSALTSANSSLILGVRYRN
jgi:hypothetical protein